MRPLRQFLRFASIAGVTVVLTGCTYYTALQQLSAAERTTFHAYSKVMTRGQARAYLSKPTAAERAAYLEQIGISQRFQTLTPQDREAVLAGFPRQGMSAEALRFLWGEPYYTKGHTGRYEHWYYLGSSLSLAESGNLAGEAGTMVIVDLINGQVQGWLETSPTGLDTGGNDGQIH
jgi:hypothetical protein